MRLQIALDAARGLEYIHEHTKPHYVHRDVKTSNILLDGSFRAKVCVIIHVAIKIVTIFDYFYLYVDIRFWFGQTRRNSQ